MAKAKKKPKRAPRNPPGRPTDCTPELTHQFHQLRAAGNHIKTCCEALAISEDSYFEWMRKAKDDQANGRVTPYTKFSESMAQARGLFKASTLETIKKAGTTGERPDWRALAWVLERVYPDEFADKSKLQVQHAGQVQHEHKTGITVILPPAIATPRPIRQIEAHSEPPKPENPGQ